MACLDKLASFLLYALILDFSLEILDFIHRLYESEESIGILSQLIYSKLFISLTIVQSADRHARADAAAGARPQRARCPRRCGASPT